MNEKERKEWEWKLKEIEGIKEEEMKAKRRAREEKAGRRETQKALKSLDLSMEDEIKIKGLIKSGEILGVKVFEV